MNESKNKHLAKEITDFCKERLAQPVTKKSGIKSFLHASLIAALALIFSSSPDSPGKKIGW